MDSKKKFQRNESIVYREEEDGAFLFDPDTGNLKFMNRSGRETFLMLDGQKDVHQLINDLSGLYPEAERNRVQKDVEGFLTVLEENRFISPVSSR